jgi:hypothetical protein
MVIRMWFSGKKTLLFYAFWEKLTLFAFRSKKVNHAVNQVAPASPFFSVDTQHRLPKVGPIEQKSATFFGSLWSGKALL